MFSSAAVRNNSLRRRMSASANARPAGVISTSPSSSLGETQHHGGVHYRQQIVDLKRQRGGQPVHIVAPVVVRQHLEQTRYRAAPRVRQHLILGLGARCHGGYRLERGRQIGPREDAVNVIDQVGEAGILAVARPRQRHPEIGADGGRILAQHDDAVGQQHGFFDIVRDHEDRARGHFVALPKLQQLAAQVLGGEHIERRERLVHEEHLGLHHQRAREAHTLLHASGKLLRIGVFEAVQAHRVQDLHAALGAFGDRHAARLQRRRDIFEHRQPRKQREALKHN